MQRTVFPGGLGRRTNDPWTPEEEASLRDMASHGKSRILIALKLRRSASAVKKRATSLGLKIPSDRERRRMAS
jgi:hypothetical protein